MSTRKSKFWVTVAGATLAAFLIGFVHGPAGAKLPGTSLKPTTGGGGGAVSSVNGATGAVVVAPVGAKYIVQTADSTLTTEQVLGSLATGILKNTTTTGALSIATAGTDYENALTFGSGVARSANAITNELITGKSGGQTVIGSTVTGQNLTLLANSAAATGEIRLGSHGGVQQAAGFNFFPQYNAFVMGLGNPPVTDSFIGQVHKNKNSPVYFMISNESTGAAAAADLIIANTKDLGGGANVDIRLNGPSFTTNGLQKANGTTFWCGGGSGNCIFSHYGTGDLIWLSGGAETERMRITTEGNVMTGSGALADNSTDGYFYLRGGDDATPGTPTAYTGRYALYWNHTDKKLMIYDGAWLGATAPGVWSFNEKDDGPHESYAALLDTVKKLQKKIGALEQRQQETEMALRATRSRTRPAVYHAEAM